MKDLRKRLLEFLIGTDQPLNLSDRENLIIDKSIEFFTDDKSGMTTMQIMGDVNEETGLLLTNAPYDIVREEWNKIFFKEESPDIEEHLSSKLMWLGYFAKRVYINDNSVYPEKNFEQV